MSTPTPVTPAVAVSWSAAILTYLETTAVKHVLVVALVLGAIFVGRTWLADHDARLAADNAVKTAQAQIASLKTQQAAVAQTAKVQVTVLQKAADAVTTAPQAVKALQADPEVKAVLPSATVLPDAPDVVQVNALELFKGVNKCEQDSVNLGACTQELTLEKQIDTQKDTEIVALKKKPSFFARLGKGLKVIGCAGAGAAAGSMAGAKGAAIGAAAGAGVCQAF